MKGSEMEEYEEEVVMEEKEQEKEKEGEQEEEKQEKGRNDREGRYSLFFMHGSAGVS